MVIAKRLNLDNIFLFLFLVLFPFGQVIRIGILQPIDIVVGLGATWAVIKRFKEPGVFKYLTNFLFFAYVSWFLSVFVLQTPEVLYGLLYLIRLTAYCYFSVYVWHFIQNKTANKKLLLDSLLLVSIVSSILGWIQYFLVPSLKAFFAWGWDEHLFRLTGTFLDPTFLGLVIVFGLILVIDRFLSHRNVRDALISLFLLVSLAFTYSRASYLALVGGLILLIYHYKKLKYLVIGLAGFLALILLLPTSANHVLSFTREFSAIARLQNYKETLQIFATSPVFGVGYDNLCLAKAKIDGFANFASHACSGSDSSLLFILATTGITGLFIFIYSLKQIAINLKHSKYYTLLATSFVALFVHSLFSNSMFYPWILGWMMLLLAEVYDEDETLLRKV